MSIILDLYINPSSFQTSIFHGKKARKIVPSLLYHSHSAQMDLVIMRVPKHRHFEAKTVLGTAMGLSRAKMVPSTTTSRLKNLVGGQNIDFGQSVET